MTKLTLSTVFSLLLALNMSAIAGGDHDHEHEGSHSAEKHDDSHSGKSDKAAAQTITGEVVDLSCYLDHKAKGPGHKKCAVACAKKGLPMGILTDDNELYLFVEDHSSAKAYKEAVEHAAESITVTGKVYNTAGVRAIQVKELGEHH